MSNLHFISRLFKRHGGNILVRLLGCWQVRWNICHVQGLQLPQTNMTAQDTLRQIHLRLIAQSCEFRPLFLTTSARDSQTSRMPCFS